MFELLSIAARKGRAAGGITSFMIFVSSLLFFNSSHDRIPIIIELSLLHKVAFNGESCMMMDQLFLTDSSKYAKQPVKNNLKLLNVMQKLVR